MQSNASANSDIVGKLARLEKPSDSQQVVKQTWPETVFEHDTVHAAPDCRVCQVAE